MLIRRVRSDRFFSVHVVVDEHVPDAIVAGVRDQLHPEDPRSDVDLTDRCRWLDVAFSEGDQVRPIVPDREFEPVDEAPIATDDQAAWVLETTRRDVVD